MILASKWRISNGTCSMSKLLPFGKRSVQSAMSLWNSRYGPQFHLSAQIMALNTIRSPGFWAEASWHASDESAFIVCKNSSTFQGAGEHGFISALAFSDRNSAVQLVQQALQQFSAVGVSVVSFGQDINHFLPGCPTTCDDVASVLEECGFVRGSVVHDLESDLATYQGVSHDSKIDIRWCESRDEECLISFLNNEFSGRWPFDVQRKAKAEGGFDFVLGMFEGGECIGFAVLQKFDADSYPIGGAVWQLSLGPQWCTLGPIGVAKRVRGLGLGDYLLSCGLDLLKRLGARQCLIDWTGIPEFYERHGFQITRSYVTLRAVTSILPK